MDIRKILFEAKLKELEDEVVPFGFIDNGLESDDAVDNHGTVWYGN